MNDSSRNINENKYVIKKLIIINFSLKRLWLGYTEAVINEILRLSSTQALISRATCHKTKINGLHISAHTTVLLNTFGIHHNDQNWSNPHEFNPDRWLDEDKKSLKQNKNCSMPFGVQPRACIGEALAKTLLFSIITNVINRYYIKFIKLESSKKGNNSGTLGVFRCPYEFNLNPECRC